jgi:hypothetical protein
MFLSDMNTALDSRIVGGSEHSWDIWENSRYLDYESEYAYASVIFNTKTQEIYEATVNDKNDKHSPYRWFNPKFKEVYYKEAKERNIDPDQAWDNVKWVDIEVEQDFLEKARAIFNDFVVDTRIQVPIDLEDDVLLKLFMEAHKRDITLNQLIEEILVNLIESHNSKTTKEIISNLNY